MKYSIFIISLFFYNISQADIILDGTLGAKISLEGPNYAINADLGQQYGNNLFHSFAEFNVNTNEIATFSGPDNINNIISRVTGGNITNIDGIISSTIPNADMYLINPAGIVFGKNASLDISGSFHVSTANILRLQDGGEFNVTNPDSSILTIAPISSFGFLSGSSAITIQGSKLIVPKTKTLSIIGQDIKINNSILKASSGRINIASITQGEVADNDLSLSGTTSDLNITNTSISVSNGGDIFIRAGNFVLNNTAIQTNVKNVDAGKIDVQVDNLIATKGSRFISNTLGAGQGGAITIKAKEATEFSGEKISKNSTGRTVINRSGINVSASGTGKAGTITLNSKSLILKDGAFIGATTFKQGQGGNININTTESINLTGNGIRKNGSMIVANTIGKMIGAGKGGEININAKQIEMKDGAVIGSNSLGAGRSGVIKFNVINDIVLIGEDKRGITSRISTSTTNSGNGGTLTLQANELHIKDGAIILAIATGENSTGQGGNLNLNMNNLIKLEGISKAGQGSSITAATQSRNSNAGNGGKINLTAKNLQLTDGSQIIATSFGPGKGGDIQLNVSEKVELAGENPIDNKFKTAILASSQNTKTNAGDAGNIEMQTGTLQLNDKAEINAETWGTGLGGDIKIQANAIELNNNGTITALSKGTGYAGQIELILAERLLVKNSTIETRAESADGGNLTIKNSGFAYLVDSEITTSVSEEFGGGGNITIDLEFVILDRSTIFAKAKKGQGGNINIVATGIYDFIDEPIEEVINASSEFGIDGIVTVKTPDNNSEEGLFSLPTTLFDASKFMNTPCAQKIATNISSFIFTPSEGTSNAIGDILPSGIKLTKLQAPSLTTSNNQNLPKLVLSNNCTLNKY
ncbi:MAG TPA: filamentous hemagglutinin N-terminal domain-containing protein [Thioploca sp.]|nr:filamentous hemagglutinin N-terminal domain-containing protein [Thioploca sp.]